MRRCLLLGCLAFLGLVPLVRASEPPTAAPDMCSLLGGELDYSMDKLVMPDGTKPYYLAYTVTDRQTVSLSATLGALESDDAAHRRLLDVDVRVGDYTVDNTHKIRGGAFGFDPSDYMAMFAGATEMSLEDDPDAIRHAVWLVTDKAFKSAVKKYQRVLTNLKTKVEEEDKSGDFTHEQPSVYSEPPASLKIDRAAWADTVRKVSQLARKYPLIYSSSVSLTAAAENRHMVTSEGTRLQTGRKLLRVVVNAGTKAEDGMELSQNFIFNAASEDKLPNEQQMTEALQKVIDQVLALRSAPLVEPYTGPAILRNRASGVFFHEIFGHRIEGHRQKDVEEGQTYAKKIGEEILPDFITVRDNPTLPRFGDEDLRGFYRFDEEGVSSSDVLLVDHGVLKSFLLSRSPLKDFPQSNGHGRREPGRSVVARQGNLIVESGDAVSFAKLRELLVEECKKQDKPYGLLFEDITGGYTGTRRMGAQSFKVLPVVVYRVYADGRPDELVRGVDIVGTPLTCFSKIIHTADDPAVFNGTCGAESGSVPVSAISPSILVSQIEVEKRRREQDKPPLLPPPIADAKSDAAAQASAKSEHEAQAKGNADEALPDSPVLLNALADELNRSLTLQMEDLERPYFIQYNVDDSLTYQLTAEYGAITGRSRDRSRDFHSRVRVGGMELDNTNFVDSGGFSFGGGGGGEQASLPLDDDYVALRQAIWRASDDDYKGAVETLTKKKAYLRDKNVVDRPNDFSPAPQVQHSDPTAVLHFDERRWQDNLRQISGHFKKCEPVQDSSVRLIASAGNAYVVNSEGTRLRTIDRGALLFISATVQAADGMRIADSLTYTGDTADDFPPVENVLADVDDLVAKLTQAAQANVIEHYSGPVLFDGVATGQVFQALLADGVAGRPDPVGEQRRMGQGTENLESKLGTRILPKTFAVWDDPSVHKEGDSVLLGYYPYDTEGVAAARVDLVKDGKLESLCLSRAPTKKLSGSNGHGRRAPGANAPEAAAACLFIKDTGAVPNAELKTALIDAANDAGLEYGVRIASTRAATVTSGQADPISMILRLQRNMMQGGGAGLGDPIMAWKVYVADGHEEPFRGCEFGLTDVTALKRIKSAGDTPLVYNYIGLGLGGATPPTSIIAPPVVIDELELSKIEQEYDKPPILKAPLFRQGAIAAP
jgi:TldD protein